MDQAVVLFVFKIFRLRAKQVSEFCWFIYLKQTS